MKRKCRNCLKSLPSGEYFCEQCCNNSKCQKEPNLEALQFLAEWRLWKPENFRE